MFNVSEVEINRTGRFENNRRKRERERGGGGRGRETARERGRGKERGRKKRREREGPHTQRKPADCSAAKAQALFQTMVMLSPRTSHGGGGWGRRGDTQGSRTRHKKARDTLRRGAHI